MPSVSLPGGIQANGLAPGYIDTDLNASLRANAQFDSWVRDRTPARRWGTAADPAGPAVWLASSASDFVNGSATSTAASPRCCDGRLSPSPTIRA